ncbi:MAG: hypothetical protein U0V04_09400 [Spirosomataceae bacterium]|jgi:hypothetical protein
MFRQFTVIFLLFFNVARGQYKDRESYFYEINKAELNIAEENYSDAFYYYSRAFNYSKSPFLRDLYNATVCKFFLKDFDGAKVLLFKMAKKGVKKEVLEEKGIFDISGYNNEWRDFAPIYDQFYEERQESEYVAYLKRNLNILTTEYFKLRSEDFYFLPAENEGESDKAIRYKDFESYRNSEKRSEIKIYNKKEVETEREKLHINESELLEEIQSIVTILFEQKNILFENTIDIENQRNEFVQSVKFLTLRSKGYDEGQKKYEFDVNKFNSDLLKKIEDAFNEGMIGQYLSLQYADEFKNISRFSVRYFTIKIEDSEPCNEGAVNLSNLNFYKENPVNEEIRSKYKQLKEKYNLESIEDRMKKEIYMATKNQYFSIPYFSQKELTTVPNCDIARQMMTGATILK